MLAPFLRSHWKRCKMFIFPCPTSRRPEQLRRQNEEITSVSLSIDV